MEQELYFLIWKFLSGGPCQQAAQALQEQFLEQPELLPHVVKYDGSKETLTLDRLREDHEAMPDDYLTRLMRHLLEHCKDNGDMRNRRIRSLKDGDDNLLTMLSAFEGQQEEQSVAPTFGSLYQRGPGALQLHTFMRARDHGFGPFNKEWRLPFYNTLYKEQVHLLGHRAGVFCLAFDKTNLRLLTGSDDTLVKVWDARRGYLIHTIRGHFSVINDIAINEENTLIATASSDGYVRVWRMDNFQPVAALKSQTTVKAFTTIKFSPSPDPQTRYLLATNEDGQVRLWKWDKENLEFSDIANPIAYSCKFKGSDRLRCSSWNSTGTRFAVAGDDGFVYVFSIKAPPEPLCIRPSTNETEESQEGSENPDTVSPGPCTEEQDGTIDNVKEADVTDAKGTESATPRNAVTSGSATIQPTQASTSISDRASNEATQAPAATSNPVEQKPRGGGRRRVPNALFPNRNAQIPEQPVIPIAHLEGHLGSITDVAYNHRGDKILSGSLDGTARIWWYDKKSKRWESIVLDITEERTCIPHITPGEEDTIVMDQDEIQKDIAKTRQEGIEKTGAQKRVSGRAAFIQENIEETGGRLLLPLPLSPSTDGSNSSNTTNDASVPSSQSAPNETHGQGVPELNEADDGPVKVSMICWSADDTKCFVATTKGDIYVFSEANGYALYVLSGHNAELYAVDCNPRDPDTLISAGYDGRVIVWNLAIQKACQCYSYPNRVFLDCKYASDGASFAVVDETGTCTLYSVDSTEQYSQTRQWKRGQFFMTDYQSLKLLNDDTILDDTTGQPPHLQSYTPIIDMQGVEYPNQKKKGYGRDIPAGVKENYASEALIENYMKEVDELRISEPIPAPSVNRGLYLQRRQQFVKNDEEEAEVVYEEPPMAPPPPQAPFLLPDDPFDEDYHDEGNDDEDTSEEESEAEVPEVLSGGDDPNYDEDGPVTRSRAGRMRQAPQPTEDTVTTRRTTRRGAQRGRGRGRGRGRTTRASAAAAVSAPSRVVGTRRRRAAEDEVESSRPRTRRRVQISYRESDPDESPSDEIQVVESSSEESYHPEAEAPPSPPASGRRGKRKLRSNTLDSASEYEAEEDPVQAESSSRAAKRRTFDRHKTKQSEQPTSRNTHAATGRRGNARTAQRGQLRALSADEIKLHEPTEWISCTERTLAKYHPQVGDRVAVLSEGHRQYWNSTQFKEYFDPAHGPFENENAVVFGTIKSITWQVGPPAFARIKLHTTELVNLHDALFNNINPIWSTRGRDVVIDYCDEDGCPEFIILWERFLASMQYLDTLQVGDRVDAMYGDDKYTGTIQDIRQSGWPWPKSEHRNPWQLFHIIWDQEAQGEDLSPWEVVPSNQDFYETYDVGKRLSDTEKRRALDVIAWLEGNPEFQLYVPPVDYYRFSSYLSQIAYPICLEMVTARLENDFYRQKEAVIDDVELIRKNAQRFNNANSPASKNAFRMSSFFKSRMTNMRMPIELRGGRRRAKEESEYEDDGEEDDGLDEQSSSDDPVQDNDDESEFEE